MTSANISPDLGGAKKHKCHSAPPPLDQVPSRRPGPGRVRVHSTSRHAHHSYMFVINQGITNICPSWVGRRSGPGRRAPGAIQIMSSADRNHSTRISTRFLTKPDDNNYATAEGTLHRSH